jgi:hypothetical protein
MVRIGPICVIDLLASFEHKPVYLHVETTNGAYANHFDQRVFNATCRYTGLCSKEASKSITSCSLIGSNTFTPYTINDFDQRVFNAGTFLRNIQVTYTHAQLKGGNKEPYRYVTCMFLKNVPALKTR